MKIKQIYLVLSSALLASTWLSTLSCQARKINKDNNTNSNKALQDPENKNPNNSQMIVLPNKVLKWEKGKTYNKQQNPEYFVEKHLFDLNQIKFLSPREIIFKTPKFKTVEHNLGEWFKKGNHGHQVDFSFSSSDDTVNMQFFEFIKELGEYGNFGENPKQKAEFYYPNVAIEAMMDQKYLDTFKQEEVTSAIELVVNNLDEIILNNPFGFLPSNLSQLFYYANFESLAKEFNIASEKITKIKSNFNDQNGTFEMLIQTDKRNYFLKTDYLKQKSLKRDLDYFQYIYDRSFSLTIRTKRWEADKDNFNRIIDYRLKGLEEVGTFWVLDRVINQDKDNWELLLATNLHVFDLTKTFDKTRFESNKDAKKVLDTWNKQKELPGFWNTNSQEDTSIRKNVFIKGTRGIEKDLKSDFEFVSTKSKLDAIFSIYDQYLDASYFYYRHNASDISAKRNDDPKLFFDSKNENNLYSTTNAGADFLVLKVKIPKNNLKHILPKLDQIIGLEKEKDFYINYKTNKFHPIQTSFYAGYPLEKRTIDNKEIEDTNFRAIKSQGGIIDVQKRAFNKNDLRSLWVRYNKNLNEHANFLNDNYKKYQIPFIKDEHGMKLSIWNQHSTLYSKIKKDQQALGQGSSGSMVIDSSFNLIGINYSLSKNFLTNQTTNGINLMQSSSDNRNLISELINQLQKDKIQTVKLNRKQ
ncbi:MAG2960 family serine endopeptidase lipoprotein [Mycoplasma putrefaciens]|uniref:DUF31 domain-containing protein n=1 Tax=Mycoplasma putrefaciens Mput9231 TaxID=1292033 RepID=M9WBY8_9MOLU|nr:Hypothetical protein, predicted lipoprotein [Mycoplasma putrefaciens Mput9231]